MKKAPGSDFEMGKASGYHPCCIAYFIVRKWALDTFHLWSLIRTTQETVWSEKDNKYVLKNPSAWEHVPCPIHWLLEKVGLYIPSYHTCDECGWQQLGSKKCNIELFHESRKREIISYYRDLFSKRKSDDSLYLVIPRGRMPREIFRKLAMEFNDEEAIEVASRIDF